MKLRGIKDLRTFRTVSEPLFSAVIAFGIMLLIIGGFAFIITKIDAQDFMLSVMSTAALAVGAYAGGYISGKRRRRNGLLMGVLCGVFIFLVITLVCAAAGGVVGVNSKRN